MATVSDKDTVVEDQDAVRRSRRGKVVGDDHQQSARTQTVRRCSKARAASVPKKAVGSSKKAIEDVPVVRDDHG